MQIYMQIEMSAFWRNVFDSMQKRHREREREREAQQVVSQGSLRSFCTMEWQEPWTNHSGTPLVIGLAVHQEMKYIEIHYRL